MKVKKIVLSFLLLTLALVLFLFFPSMPRALKFAAMTLSFAADMILAEFGYLARRLGTRGFAVGMGLFMLAHLLYFGAYGWMMAGTGGAWRNCGLAVGLGVTAAVLVFTLTLYGTSHRKKRYLLVMGMLYTLIIGSVCTMVCIYAFDRGGVAFAAMIGSFSFILSDMVIGIRVLGAKPLPRSEEIIWAFYPVGQLLLIL